MSNEIINNKIVKDEYINIIKKYDKSIQINIFNTILKSFTENKELDKTELDLIYALKKDVGLTDENVNFDEKIKPYWYNYHIKYNNKLPTVNIQYEGVNAVILKKDEVVHHGVFSIMAERNKEGRLTEISRGHLFITNKRLVLHPLPNNKALSLPLSKIISYNRNGNTLEIHKEDRDTAYIFQMNNSGDSEIFRLCLGFLFEHINKKEE